MPFERHEIGGVLMARYRPKDTAETPYGLPEKIGTVLGAIVVAFAVATMVYAIGSHYV